MNVKKMKRKWFITHLNIVVKITGSDSMTAVEQHMLMTFCIKISAIYTLITQSFKRQ